MGLILTFSYLKPPRSITRWAGLERLRAIFCNSQKQFSCKRRKLTFTLNVTLCETISQEDYIPSVKDERIKIKLIKIICLVVFQVFATVIFLKSVNRTPDHDWKEVNVRS